MFGLCLKRTLATALSLVVLLGAVACSRTVTKTNPKTNETVTRKVPVVFTKEEKDPGWLWTHAFYDEDWPLVVKCAYWLGPGH